MNELLCMDCQGNDWRYPMTRVVGCKGKSAEEICPGLPRTGVLSRLRVECIQKRMPRFRRLAKVWHEEDALPACPSTGSNGRLRRGGSLAASFSPLPSANRGKEYLPLQAASVRAHPGIPEAFRHGAGRWTWTPVERPGRRQIPAGS